MSSSLTEDNIFFTLEILLKYVINEGIDEFVDVNRQDLEKKLV